MKTICAAYARSTGRPCQARSLANGRCMNHGGLSTGPRTAEGRAAVGVAAKARLAAGHQKRLLAGYQRWLGAGGREMLSRLLKARLMRKRFAFRQA
jgi:hypothetical protein